MPQRSGAVDRRRNVPRVQPAPPIATGTVLVSSLEAETLGSDEAITPPPQNTSSITSPEPLPFSQDPDAAPRVGRYTLLNELGRGGMGVVYRAWDPELDRPVALKMLLHGRLATEVQRQRFLREARIVALLKDPAIVAVYDWGLYQDCPYYTMDLVNGPTLRTLLQAGALAAEQAAAIIAEAAKAVHYAHSQGVVHRDIKPANILMADGIHPCISDFGVARIQGLENASDPDAPVQGELTVTGHQPGTPAYMAPEQAAGDGDRVGPLSDVYSLGAVLFHMLSGYSPAKVSESNPPRTALEAPSPRRARTSIPVELDRVCRKAMAPHPQDRYSSALALAEDAQRFLRGEPVLASRPGLMRRARWQLWHHRAVILASMGALSLAIILMLGWQVLKGQRAAQLEQARESRASERLSALKPQLQADWKAGRDSEAAAALAAFVELPEVRGTGAVSQALLLAGDHALRSDRLDNALESISRAYVLAEKPAQQQAALYSFAPLFDRLGDFPALQALDALATRRKLVAQTPPAEPSLALRVARARRDLPALLSLLQAPELQALGPVLTAFTQYQDTGQQSSGLMTRLPMVGRAREGVSVEGASPAMSTVPGAAGVGQSFQVSALTPPPGTTFVAPPVPLGTWQGAPLYMLALNPAAGEPTRTGLHALHSNAWQEVFPVGSARTFAACDGDLDGDGVPEYYIGMNRRLISVVADGKGGLREEETHGGTNEALSEIRSLFAYDLDGDGRQELVAGLDGWRAYDVRVYRATAVPGKLELVARRKLGSMVDVAPLPYPSGGAGILVSRASNEPNLRVFPASAPAGVAAGVWLLHLEKDKLELINHVAPAFRDAVFGQLATGDFDGDGRAEVVVHGVLDEKTAREGVPRRHYLELMVFQPDKRVARVTLPGLQPTGVVQADQDAAHELVVREESTNRLWILGVAGAPLPSVINSLPTTLQEEVAPEASDAWARAQDLLELGVMERGVEPFSQLAVATSDRALAALALVRQAGIAAQLKQWERAAELYHQAATKAPPTPEDLMARAEAHRQLWRHSQALEAWEAAAQHPQAQASLRLQAQAKMEQVRKILSRPVFTADFSKPLDSAWQQLAPHLVFRASTARETPTLSAPAHHLAIQSYGHVRDLALLPLQWDGGRLSIETEITIQRLEQGAVLQLGIRSEAGAPPSLMDLRISGWGGGSLLRLKVQSAIRGEGRSLWEPELKGPSQVERIRVRLELDPETGTVLETCNSFDRVRRLNKPIPPAPGRYLFYLRSRSDWPRSLTAVEASISSLTIQGVTLVPNPAPDPRQVAQRLLAEGEFEQARALIGTLKEDTEDTLELRLLTACEQRISSECLEWMARAERGDETQRNRLRAWLEIQVRRSPALYMPVVTRLLGSEALEMFYKAWALVAYAHPEDTSAQLAFTTGLSHLDARTIPTVTSFLPAARQVELLLFQGRSWFYLGHPRMAWTVLDEAAAAAKRLQSLAKTSEERREANHVEGEIALEAAQVYAASRRPDLSLARLEYAFAVDPSPEILADVAASRGVFEPLLEAPTLSRWLGPSPYPPMRLPR